MTADINSNAPHIEEKLKAAEQVCLSRGVRLTSLRRRVLEILLQSAKPVKAYDLVEMMKDNGKRITPATIYRSLEFLQEHDFVHRVNALNAYIACTGAHEQNNVVMLVCSKCHKTDEINDALLHDCMVSRLESLGFPLHADTVEIHGVCPDCHCTCRVCSDG